MKPNVTFAVLLVFFPSITQAFYDKDSNLYDASNIPQCDAGPAFDATSYGIDTSANGFMDDHACINVTRNEKVHQICWRDGNADFDSGDVAWMLCATTFVMLQTPAAGFAQAGLVRRKNAVSVIGQAFIGVVIGCILWYAFGYSLTFGPSCGSYGCRPNDDQAGFIGDITSHYFFHGITAYSCSGSIPTLLFAAFQMTFALMVPVLVTGAWAEKFQLTSAILFMIVWPILVYYPSAHWVWGGGFMTKWGDVGVLDYAGGVVIHTSSGVASFVVALMLQKRRNYASTDTTHNIPLTMIGAALIWVGWFSFNGGSGLRANGQAIGALTVTQISSCFAAMTWGILSYIQDKRIQATHIASGALCGLAGITPGSGFVLPYAGIPIGILTGMAGWYGGILVKQVVKLDDVLDVTSLQAFPGAVGTILVGFFATNSALPCEAPTYPGKPCGRSDDEGMGIFHGGNGKLLGAQIAAIVTMIVWSAAGTFATMWIIKQTTGLNVSSEEEELGLDIAHHGEKAYDIDYPDDLEDQAKVVKLINASISGDIEEVRRVIRRFGVHPEKVDVDGRTGLHLACKHGHLDVVKLFIEEYQLSPNIPDLKGIYPLREAQVAGHKAVVDFLTAQKAIAVTDESDATRMLLAASKGDVHTLNKFLKGGLNANTADYDQRTPLHLAATEGHLDAVKLLLAHGANPELQDRWGRTPADDAVRHLKGDVASLIHDFRGNKMEIDLNVVIPQIEVRRSVASTGTMEVLIAGRNGDVTELKRLKAKGENLNGEDYDGRTALHQAAQAGHLQAVMYLSQIPGCNINHKDHDHKTPLADAIHGNHSNVVEFLQTNGGIVDVSHGEMCILAGKGDIEGLSRLINAGVDVNSSDYDGRTALHIAVASGQVEVVKMLLDRHADFNIRDRMGGTPLDDAMRNGNDEIKRALTNAGAQIGGMAQRARITKTAPGIQLVSLL